MKTLVSVVLLALLVISPAFAYEWEVNPANGHSYTVIDCVSWTDAKSKAEALGGYLVTISDAAENEWVRSVLSPMAPGRWAVIIGMYQPNGGSDPSAPWVWVTGESFTYTNWDVGQPSGDGPYGYMFEENGKWNDGQLNWPVAFVEVGPIPEPTSILALFSGITIFGILKRRR